MSTENLRIVSEAIKRRRDEYKKERDEARAELAKEKETHKSVMKHWLETNKKMMKKANDHYEGVEKENLKFKKALERIANSKECEVCRCQQIEGKTVDGVRFIHLQNMAKKALKK